jgi:hypothetical protein
MADRTIISQATTQESVQVDAMKVDDFTARAGEICDGPCHKPMTAGQPFYAIGNVRRIYVCATCALLHVRSAQ